MRLSSRNWFATRFGLLAVAALTCASIPAVRAAQERISEIGDFSDYNLRSNHRFKGIIPNGRVTVFHPHSEGGTIAWLGDARKSSAHRALGGGVAAGAVIWAKSNAGRITSLKSWRLTDGTVLEDLKLRLVSFDGKNSHLLTVRSDSKVGASLFLMDINKPGELSPSNIQSDPLGRPNDWINPIGVSDFDSDGEVEIAAVVSPHTKGVLTLFRLEGTRLVPKPMIGDISNHAIGTPDLRLHWIIDWNEDGVKDIVIPDQSRTVMRFISLKGGVAREIDRVDLGSEMIPPMKVRSGGFESLEIEVRLRDGRAVGVSR